LFAPLEGLWATGLSRDEFLLLSNLKNRQQLINFPRMENLADVEKVVEELSREERARLVAHLMASLQSGPLGPEDEVAAREIEMDSGLLTALSRAEFLAAMRRQ
jgi:predicted transcriptional regulator